jgi:hypothetical protein
MQTPAKRSEATNVWRASAHNPVGPSGPAGVTQGITVHCVSRCCRRLSKASNSSRIMAHSSHRVANKFSLQHPRTAWSTLMAWWIWICLTCLQSASFPRCSVRSSV